MTELRFDGRVVVVTGAGRGVGRGHALHLAAKGAHLVVAYYGVVIDGAGSSPGPAEEVVREINALGGDAVSRYASVTEIAPATSIVQTALDALGRIDAVSNNAGIHDPATFPELPLPQFRAMLDVHFFGTLHVTHAAWPHFVRTAYRRVINTASEAMLAGIPGLSSYGAAKGVVFGLTRNLATEVTPHGICVNAITPRAYTRMSASHSEVLAQHLSMPQGAGTGSAALVTARVLGDQLRHLPVDFGIGLTAGEVFAGNIGAENHHEYTLIGDPVNEAVRLADLAKTSDSPILCSAAAVKGADSDECQYWSQQGTALLRGHNEPTQLYASATATKTDDNKREAT